MGTSKKIKKLLVIILLFISYQVNAQIFINGKGPRNSYGAGGKTAISISYGSLFWNDSQQKEINGSTAGLEDFNVLSFSGFDKFNYNISLRIGLEKGLSDKISIKSYLTTGRLFNGVLIRPDLEVTDKSRIIQLSTYGNLILSKPEKKFKFHFLFGPDFMYVKRDALIKDYITAENSVSDDYQIDENIFEVGVSTGLGLSYDISNHVVIFSDGLMGISLPGGGLKISNSGLGLKYIF
ncbi:hypothetical protein A5893_13805 [Pedobacter psychrophilus]|uniref:Outer membrane protein beta-barrel domain-containing protein n=1 Tax=Pedobacter psychrophilus TaxID=1826909 RepID=A0A179DBR6_9SPHI|nr:hypothetical protein [Pedobacter psychrophilus]OAQ38495.1 hypothetical protein A5893_13805 [Pedobacter psychrophilus]